MYRRSYTQASNNVSKFLLVYRLEMLEKKISSKAFLPESRYQNILLKTISIDSPKIYCFRHKGAQVIWEELKDKILLPTHHCTDILSFSSFALAYSFSTLQATIVTHVDCLTTSCYHKLDSPVGEETTVWLFIIIIICICSPNLCCSTFLEQDAK